MKQHSKKSLMRNLGEFFGHLVKAARTDPETQSEKTEVRRTESEQVQDNMTLRRTIIDEIEFRGDERDTSESP